MCSVTIKRYAGVAQLAEQLIRNQQVAGSIPVASSIYSIKCLEMIIMGDNIFLKDVKPIRFEDYMTCTDGCRGNLGDEIPVAVYRLLEYSLKEKLIEQFGKEKQVEIFRNAGRRAGEYFASKYLNLEQPLDSFISELQDRLAEMKIGVLRVEDVDDSTGRIILTVAEDADCSGLPVLGETVCNYDEGFISGVLTKYSGNNYNAVEVDCWATGDRVCRFRAEID